MSLIEGIQTWDQELDKGTDTVKYIPLYDKFKTSNSTQTGEAAAPAELPYLAGNDMNTMTEELRYIPPRAETARPYSSMPAGIPSYSNYYQRVASVPHNMNPTISSTNKLYVEPGAPVFRSGRLGAPWRHIRQCTGNLGNHICFVDGVVKNSDMQMYPPYGYSQPEERQFLPPFLEASQKQALGARSQKPNQFQAHAKKGFKYWHDEKVPMSEPVTAKRTIQGRLMKLGVGY